MPLIHRLAKDHTIREFRAAALLRFREASRLALGGDRLAAIYLCGYAVEMLLKAAYFRLKGWRPADPIRVKDIQDAKTYATSLLGMPWRGNLHHLPSWAALLVEERIIRGSAYPVLMARGLQARIKRVYLNWHEQLRYRPNRPYRGEVAVVLQNAEWLLGQFRFL